MNRDHWEAEAYEFAERLKATRAELAKARATVDEVTHVANLAQEKAAHYRDRCPVEASDVEAAGVCRRRAVVWAEAHAPELARSLEHVWSKTDGPQTLAIDINAVSEAVGRPAMKILDEMAAIEVPP